jgi:peptidoglycan/LPS O-acetylase OafA/YrhL
MGIRGLAALGLPVKCDQWIEVSLPGDRRALLLALLQSPIAVGLGLLSHSLYLIHSPILALVRS